MSRKKSDNIQSGEYGLRKKNKANLFNTFDHEPMVWEAGLDNGTSVAGRLKIPKKWQTP